MASNMPARAFFSAWITAAISVGPGIPNASWYGCATDGAPDSTNFKSDGKDFLILGCPHCRLWAKKTQTIAGLVDEWSKLVDRKREENKRKNGSAGLADLLNGLDE